MELWLESRTEDARMMIEENALSSELNFYSAGSHVSSWRNLLSTLVKSINVEFRVLLGSESQVLLEIS